MISLTEPKYSSLATSFNNESEPKTIRHNDVGNSRFLKTIPNKGK